MALILSVTEANFLASLAEQKPLDALIPHPTDGAQDLCGGSKVLCNNLRFFIQKNMFLRAWQNVNKNLNEAL